MAGGGTAEGVRERPPSAIALRIFFRGPSGMPSVCRSESVKSARTGRSTSCSAKTAAYFSRPRSASHRSMLTSMRCPANRRSDNHDHDLRLLLQLGVLQTRGKGLPERFDGTHLD